MKQYINIIKGTYLQYVRSYSFLITIAVSLFLAFGIIPAPDADYVTMRFGEFTGAYNSAWIGTVTAIIASIFLSLCGFFLINGSIKRDIESRIGHIIGTTKISNAKYILTKVASNFLILMTILGVIFIVSIMLFVLYGQGHAFHLMDFIAPYAVIAIPSLVVVSSLSVMLEVFIPKKTTIQYGLFFAFFIFVLFASTATESSISSDVFGIHYPTDAIANQIETNHANENVQLTIGFVSGGVNPDKIATIVGSSYPTWYVLSRLFWVFGALFLALISSVFFHRFDIKEKLQPQQNLPEYKLQKSAGFQLKNIDTHTTISTGLMPLVCAEIIMLIRKNVTWIWILTLIGMIAMVFVPLSTAHQFILPIVWFLQVTIWSDLVSKDFTLRTHYFTASSYKPMRRLFISRIIAGYLVALSISIPLMVRLIIDFQFAACINIALGGAFIVLLAVFFGVLTRSKKLFEISFFFLIYCNINLVSITDYFGAIHSSVFYTAALVISNIMLFSTATFLKMNYDR